jgi:hypothetical protein
MEEKIEKIVVKAGDELIDVVRKISSTEAKKILVSFVEDSDILISSINLKVLLDSADEKEANLILQIPNNATGVRNAKLAGIPVVDSPGIPSEDVWEEARSEYKDRNEKNSQMKSKLPQDYKSENITSFEERINSVLTKNREEREGVEKQEEKKDEVKKDESPGIVIDKDISHDRNTSNKDGQEDLTRVDFKNVPNPTKKKSVSKESSFSTFFSKIKEFFTNLVKKDKKSKDSKEKKKEVKVKGGQKKKFVKLLPKLLIPIVAVIILVFVLYLYFAPYVRATIFIESKPVEVEKVFEGSENVNEIDFEDGQIPIKTETVTKSVSDVVEATGTAFRGEEATGNVTISYISPGGCTDADEPINLSVGQQVTTDGKNFVLTGGATLICNDFSTVGVEAVEVGEEYNIPARNYFSVNGYDTSKVFGTNSSAFSGGSKEEYTVLSNEDVNTKVEELTDIAFGEAESSLQDIGNGWELIESTVKSKVKEGSVETAVAIGSETTSSDVSLEVEASATYYFTQGVDEGLNNLLTEAALNQNLFESGEGLNLSLKGDIEKELKVSEDDGDVEITLTASSSVEPAVDRESLIEDLRGMKWEEGLEYLNSLTFTADKDPVVRFEPESFPKSLRSFPSRQGRIYLEVKELVEEN